MVVDRERTDASKVTSLDALTIESAVSVTHTNPESLLQYSVLIGLVPQSCFISSHAKNKVQGRTVWLKPRTASTFCLPLTVPLLRILNQNAVVTSTQVKSASQVLNELGILKTPQTVKSCDRLWLLLA